MSSQFSNSEPTGHVSDGSCEGMIRPWRAFMKEQPSTGKLAADGVADLAASNPVNRPTQLAVDSPGKAARNLLAQSTYGRRQQILWIDGVGGFLMLDQDEVVLGQAVSADAIDIRIVGDVRRQAAAIRRDNGDYLLQPLQPTKVNGVTVERPQLLSNEDVVQFGDRVQVRFNMPNPLSATAKLELVSLNKFKPNVDGVLLLSDSCILGPDPGSHVLCPSWSHELLMFRHGEKWYFRTLDDVEVNGTAQKGQIPVESGMRMKGGDFSLSVE
ncbi:MAG: FHA domain-containing protein [Aureliella sp.]